MPDTLKNSKLDTSEIAKEWRFDIIQHKRPNLRDACELIMDLCLEVANLRSKVEELEKSRVIEAQQYDVMIIEIQNVVNKYRKLC